MKAVTKYASITTPFRLFDTEEEAIADEDRLQEYIDTCEKRLAEMTSGPDALYLGRPVKFHDITEKREALAGYKAKWAQVLAERAAENHVHPCRACAEHRVDVAHSAMCPVTLREETLRAAIPLCGSNLSIDEGQALHAAQVSNELRNQE